MEEISLDTFRILYHARARTHEYMCTEFVSHGRITNETTLFANNPESECFPSTFLEISCTISKPNDIRGEFYRACFSRLGKITRRRARDLVNEILIHLPATTV